MVVVDDLLYEYTCTPRKSTYLDEGLDLAAASELLGTHSPGHLERVALNTGGNDVREAVLLVTLVVLLDNNDLQSS